MEQIVNVTSEIGRLKKVLLHRPGRELENLVPEYLGRLLFDDIPYLKIAREEHDKFAQVLKDNGVQVFYIEDLLAKSICDEDVKKNFIDEFLHESGITSPSIYEGLFNYLFSMKPDELVDTVIAGVGKKDIKFDSKSSLSEIMYDEYPFYLDPMPNVYFMRDPAAIIGSGISINKMKTRARERETLFTKYIYNNYSKKYNIPLWYDRNSDFSIEGGDILVLSKEVVAIGCSERTSPDAIQQIAKKLLSADGGFKKILVFDIPKYRAFMHLDTVFTMVDYNKFTIFPNIQSGINIYEITLVKDGNFKVESVNGGIERVLAKTLGIDDIVLVECGGGDPVIASREQWNDGSNTLAIAPDVVITYERNSVTNEMLDKKGVKVISIPSSELSRGRGGPRCMSMPLERENI